MSNHPSRANPATHGLTVTKSDSTTYDACRGIWVGGAGDLAVLLRGDTVPVTIVAVPAGSLLPLDASKVMSTSTTATSIVILY